MTDSPAIQAHARWYSCRSVPLETDDGLAAESLQQYDCEPSPALLLGVPADTFGLQMLGRLPYGSPLAPSSIGQTESVCPPSETHMPIGSRLASPVFQHVQSPPDSDAWSDEQEPRWQHSHPGPSTWCPRALSLLCQRWSACNQGPTKCIRDYLRRLDPLSTPCSVPYQTSIPYTAAEVDPALFQQDLAVGPNICEENSESEPDLSGRDDGASSCELSDSSTRQYGANSGAMELGKWGHITYPFYEVVHPRQYWCPLMNKRNPQSPCAKSFQRPEHLRRHVVTVHGGDKRHPCKVCPKLFSRRDNLREHYWTHVNRGERAGRNVRMSISELTGILGPKEKRLLKRLKRKMDIQQARRTEARS
ncbi:MSN2-like protein [Alternaria alternata]|nr:MSN2-like protein [Alternaria alternata]